MIFVDTSFWIALRNQRDAHHGEAKRLLVEHAGIQLTTTNHVRGETWTYLRRRAGHPAAVAFLDVIDESPRVRVVAVSEEAEHRALAWLRHHDEREYSFVDATSFTVMRTMRMQEALAFDGDFSAAGFTERRA
ncbi:MAG: type II toxin-antitoxin system VapC family toxin [Acidimicrobiales bacterium]